MGWINLISKTLPYLPQKMVWFFSKRYIAGEQLSDALRTSLHLNEKMILVTVDLLGEFITTMEQARHNLREYLKIIDKFEFYKVKGNFSIKPTSFGLLLDKEECFQIMRTIVEKASECKRLVRIDMEDSKCVDLEMELFRRLHREFPANVGLAVQAYLRRTMFDVQKLMDLHSPQTPLNFRLCKGIYIESEDIAFKKPAEINQSYLSLLDFMLEKKMYVGIATHDKKIINAAFDLIRKHKANNLMYEFQMLYGVTPNLRAKIVKLGHRMRVYVPFGKQWFNYSTRRLKENPKIISHIIKSFFVYPFIKSA